MERYWNPIETAPIHELRALQSLRLSQTVRHVYEHVPFYRKKFDEMGLKPEDTNQSTIFPSCRLLTSRICAITILMVCLPYRWKIWRVFMLPVVRLVSRR